MIKRVSDLDSCELLAEIYNSAIMLFPKNERADITADAFAQQMKDDINYIYFDETEKAKAFFSYKVYSDNVYELTSLYVSRDVQRLGVGGKCMEFFEAQIPKNSIVYIKVLRNAPWSIEFYEKTGFIDASADAEYVKSKYGISIHKWSTLMKKEISR
ncbi:MAG: GNAT family N-acetyltransferase [Lachnospiraceae bacterium]|nr:GNAT family N-acetyltransferase [Lachnospiraceae bacterium]